MGAENRPIDVLRGQERLLPRCHDPRAPYTTAEYLAQSFAQGEASATMVS